MYSVRSKLTVTVRIRTVNRQIHYASQSHYLCHMIQQIIIGLIFLGAAIYLGRMVYRSFQAKNACSSGCGKCAAADLEKEKAVG